MALFGVILLAFCALMFGVWRVKRMDKQFIRMNKQKQSFQKKVVRLISDSSEPSSTEAV